MKRHFVTLIPVKLSLSQNGVFHAMSWLIQRIVYLLIQFSYYVFLNSLCSKLCKKSSLSVSLIYLLFFWSHFSFAEYPPFTAYLRVPFTHVLFIRFLCLSQAASMCRVFKAHCHHQGTLHWAHAPDWPPYQRTTVLLRRLRSCRLLLSGLSAALSTTALLGKPQYGHHCSICSITDGHNQVCVVLLSLFKRTFCLCLRLRQNVRI